MKRYYKEVLNETEISKKGGAGLGLIEMARKSGNKLAFDFTEVNSVYSFFYLHLEISRSKEEEDAKIKASEFLFFFRHFAHILRHFAQNTR